MLFHRTAPVGRTLAIGILAAAFSACAQAGVIWDTYGASIETGYLGNGTAAHTNAQAFHLSQATAITDFGWNGVYVNNQAPSSENFVIDIYASTAGTPSNTPLLSINAGSANRSDSGGRLFNFYDIYDYTASPQLALTLGSGDYFFSVNDSANGWYWGVASTSSGSFFVRDNLGPWDKRTSTLTFRIDGNTVPEPASLALTGTALLGLLAARRRKG